MINICMTVQQAAPTAEPAVQQVTPTAEPAGQQATPTAAQMTALRIWLAGMAQEATIAKGRLQQREEKEDAAHNSKHYPNYKQPRTGGGNS